MSDTPIPSIPADWLEVIAKHVQVDAKSKDHATDEMLKVQNNKVGDDAILPLLHYLRVGDKNQQHDAAKAIGYIARTGALGSKQRETTRNSLLEIIRDATLSAGVAFAILEALDRVDPDAFWTLVIKWYEDYAAKREKAKVDAVLHTKADIAAESNRLPETAAQKARNTVVSAPVVNSNFVNLDNLKKEGSK